MSNKRREGLMHFPLDVDIFDDDKLYYAEEIVDTGGYDTQLRLLIDKVLLRLFCIIYRNGYQIPWDMKMRIAITQKMGNGMNITLLDKVISAMLAAGLFSQDMFDNKQVLTSKRIQETWIDVVYRARRVHQTINPEYLLLSEKEIKMIRSGKRLSATGNLISVAETSKSAADSLSQNEVFTNKTLSKQGISGKKEAETAKNDAEKAKRNSKNTNKVPQNVDNLPQKDQTAAEKEQSATEIEKNVAESAKPFTLILSNNNSNKGIDNTIENNRANIENINNTNDVIVDFSKNVAETTESATEIEKPVAEPELADIKMIIQPGDKTHYPIEVCLYNITHPNFSRAFEQICISFQLTPERFEKWALAFNRMLVKKSDFKRPMIGNDSWAWYLGNWIGTNDDWQNIDPDTLFKQYGTVKSRPAAANAKATIPGSGATEEERKNFYKPRTYEQH